MTAHEVAGYTETCLRHGDYIGTGPGCPVCAGLRKPAPRARRVGHEKTVEAELRRRPKSGPVEL